MIMVSYSLGDSFVGMAALDGERGERCGHDVFGLDGGVLIRDDVM